MTRVTYKFAQIDSLTSRISAPLIIRCVLATVSLATVRMCCVCVCVCVFNPKCVVIKERELLCPRTQNEQAAVGFKHARRRRSEATDRLQTSQVCVTLGIVHHGQGARCELSIKRLWCTCVCVCVYVCMSVKI